jgi:TPR repeat protein
MSRHFYNHEKDHNRDRARPARSHYRRVLFATYIIAAAIAITACSRSNKNTTPVAPGTASSAAQSPQHGIPKSKLLDDHAAEFLAYGALSGDKTALTKLQKFDSDVTPAAAYGFGVYYENQARLTRFSGAANGCGSGGGLDVSKKENERIEQDLIENGNKIALKVAQLCDKAIASYRKASTHGDPAATYRLALMQLMTMSTMQYFHDKGITAGDYDTDMQLACQDFLHLTRLAASEHDASAEIMLAGIFRSGSYIDCSGRAGNLSMSYKWADSACTDGDGSECAAVAGVYYDDGMTDKAERFIKMAIKHGNNRETACAIQVYYADKGAHSQQTKEWSKRCQTLTNEQYAKYPVLKTLGDIGEQNLKQSLNSAQSEGN